VRRCLVRAMYPSAAEVALSTWGAITNVELCLFYVSRSVGRSVSCRHCRHIMQYVFVLCLCECRSFNDISCIGGASSLSELALDGNPMTHELSYKQTVLRHVSQIRQLDMKRVTVSTY